MAKSILETMAEWDGDEWAKDPKFVHLELEKPWGPWKKMAKVIMVVLKFHGAFKDMGWGN